MGVRQDKETPRRFNIASEQPSNVHGVAFQRQTDEKTPAFQRPKHHGSQKRQVVAVTGCVPRFIADQLEQMRDQGGKPFSRPWHRTRPAEALGEPTKNRLNIKMRHVNLSISKAFVTSQNINPLSLSSPELA